MRIVGVVLVVLGLVGVLWGGLSWTRQKPVVDVGPVEINTETRESLPIPPIAGAVLLVAGVALIVGTRR
jgi:hypothetical protein